MKTLLQTCASSRINRLSIPFPGEVGRGWGGCVCVCVHSKRLDDAAEKGEEGGYEYSRIPNKERKEWMWRR